MSQILKYFKKCESNTCKYSNIKIMQIIQIMWVITCIIPMFYVSNASNYLHYWDVFMWVMWVITCIIWSISDIRIIWNFEYFESNFVLCKKCEFSSQGLGSSLARPRYASICEYMPVLKYLKYFLDIWACLAPSSPYYIHTESVANKNVNHTCENWSRALTIRHFWINN